MTFNQTFGVNGVSVTGNNFSGPVPTWADQPTSILAVHPGNEGVCGQVCALLPWSCMHRVLAASCAWVCVRMMRACHVPLLLRAAACA